MDNSKNYVVHSLELHLFFARIMKEHSLFLKAGFTPANAAFGKQAECFMQEFEDLLSRTVRLSNGVVSNKVLRSGEIVTEFTACAEKQTQCFTGICINKEITERERRLRCGENVCISMELRMQVKHLNQTAMRLLDRLIDFKENVIENVLSCNMITMNYPSLLEHILHEAKNYRTYVCCLEKGMGLHCESMLQTEQFWNQIMMEHALFIRGSLDPTEKELIKTSNSFAKDYERLLCEARKRNDMKMLHCMSLEETLEFKEFKEAGAKGIQECKIRSIILPLLADHVLREANFYIRLLNNY